jgi:hypothetical protein
MYHTLIQPLRNPAAADAAALAGLYRRWREDLLPSYRDLVAAGAAEVPTAAPPRLVDLIEEIARTAGVHLAYLAIVGGAAWKMDKALARFARRHLPGVLPDGVTVLLTALPGAGGDPPRYAVVSLDWWHPTLGERRHPEPGTAANPAPRSDRRCTAEDACRAALAGRPRLARRFAVLLATTQRYALIREEQARLLTLGWPLLRTAVHRLGRLLRTAGVVDEVDDVFFLTRAELTAGLSQAPPRLSEAAAARRAVWQRQRRLPAPLSLGHAPRFLRAVLGQSRPAGTPDDVLVGQPPAPVGPPARYASSTAWTSSTSSRPGRSWSPRPPHRRGRCCWPAPRRWSPMAALSSRTRRWSPASTPSPPWSPPATRPAGWSPGRSSPLTAPPAPSPPGQGPEPFADMRAAPTVNAGGRWLPVSCCAAGRHATAAAVVGDPAARIAAAATAQASATAISTGV